MCTYLHGKRCTYTTRAEKHGFPLSFVGYDLLSKKNLSFACNLTNFFCLSYAQQLFRNFHLKKYSWSPLKYANAGFIENMNDKLIMNSNIYLKTFLLNI